MTSRITHYLKVVLMLVLITSLSITSGIYLSTASATGASLIHQFDFYGNLTDSLGTGTPLTVHPNTATSGFGDGEWWWTATSSPGGGLILQTSLLTDPSNYSLGFRIKYNQVGPSWRKIISFKGPGDDNGLYFYNSNLQFYPFGSNTDITYSANTFYDFIFTRSSDHVIRVYVVEGDGTVTKVYERDDPSNATVPILVDGKYQFMFFMDDVATSGEWTTGGTVRSIRLWNGVINEEYVGDALSDVTTGTATDITDTSATLQGSVNPYGLETNVYFEYGLSNSYGTEVMADQSPITGSTDVSKTISGLESNNTYHFRVKAVNSAGTIYGADQTFTTAEPPVTVPVTGVTLNHTELTLLVGDEPVSLVATVEPSEADNKNVTWSSSDVDVATVVDGVVTPVGPGTAIITVTTEDGGFTAECAVAVNMPEGWTVTKLADPLTFTLARGESRTIEYTIITTNRDSNTGTILRDDYLELNGVKAMWSEAMEGVISIGGFEFTRDPVYSGPLTSPDHMEGSTYTYNVTVKNVSAEYDEIFGLVNEASLSSGDELVDAVTVTVLITTTGELPRTGGFPYYGFGLLIMVGSVLLKKKR